MGVLGASVEVTVERDLGRVDLNTASNALIFAVFAANGVEDDRAHLLADRIEDWKDADDSARDHGAERSQYVAAGLHYVPRNGPFESVDELRQVLGCAEIDAALFDAFTVSRIPKCHPRPLRKRV